MEIPVVENILKLNDEIAALNRADLKARRLFTFNLIGGPGCGKTALLEATLQAVSGQRRVGVIVGDLTTARDAQRLARWCPAVVQVNTGKGCHLEAHHVRHAFGRLPMADLDLVIIENVGNLICPVGFDLGQDVKVGMFSATEGDDKPAKHPYIVCEAALLILNKIDLLPHVPFDLGVFHADVRRLNPQVRLLELSARTGQGLAPWLEWIEAGIRAAGR